jgi:hypothetical protein
MVGRWRSKLSELSSRVVAAERKGAVGNGRITLSTGDRHTLGLPNNASNFPKSETPKDYADYTVGAVRTFCLDINCRRDPVSRINTPILQSDRSRFGTIAEIL